MQHISRYSSKATFRATKGRRVLIPSVFLPNATLNSSVGSGTRYPFDDPARPASPSTDQTTLSSVLKSRTAAAQAAYANRARDQGTRQCALPADATAVSATRWSWKIAQEAKAAHSPCSQRDSGHEQDPEPEPDVQTK